MRTFGKIKSHRPITKETEPQNSFGIGNLMVHVHETRQAMGAAAAIAVAERLRTLAAQHEMVSVIFSTGASQVETLHELTNLHVPWTQVVGFHMDEYIGIPGHHPASFRSYLRELVTSRVPLQRFFEIDGTSADPEGICRDYAQLLHAHPPQLCLLGIGENGHLAFNDPSEADFEDPCDVKVVRLDEVCRQQQVNEGWFPTLAEVPRQAITLTIPTIMRVPQLIVSVPGTRKARIVERALKGPISTDCPATILRRHPNSLLLLDKESAAHVVSSREETT